MQFWLEATIESFTKRLRINDESPTTADLVSEDEITSPIFREEEPLDSLHNGIIQEI